MSSQGLHSVAEAGRRWLSGLSGDVLAGRIREPAAVLVRQRSMALHPAALGGCILACLLVIPWAWCFGGLREIPWGWRLIDCSFGVGGLVPMLLIRSYIAELKRRQKVGVTY